MTNPLPDLRPPVDSTALRIIVTQVLPLKPTLAQDTIRSVRHGLADVLNWLGEDVGPIPGALTHVFRSGGKLFVSAEMFRGLGGIQ
ncbi:hypothetical protein AAFM46_10920 [Arthrobacter sp. TMP15]|uniref:hypothetical protein n=1 Tax=Arthrobacter sp. TMP15 TaxID=3140789 RepID=UPI0031BA0006